MSPTPKDKRVWSLYLDKVVDGWITMASRVQGRSKSYVVAEILRDHYIREPEARKREKKYPNS
jgi:hypothetical protein